MSFLGLNDPKPVITISVPEPANARSGIALILDGARERVRQGWVQGMGASPDGRRVCAANAVCLIANRLGQDHIAYAAQMVLLKAAEETTTLYWDSIPQWNDTPGRTLDEVIDTFDHAIKLVERDS